MAKRLLVEGLDWGVSEGQLMRIFAPFGDLDEARIAVDWETGRSRGFGYITFRDSGDAEAAIAGLDGQKLAGKTLRVMVAPEQAAPAARSSYRGGDYGHVDEEPGSASAGERDTKPLYRNADFDGSGKPAPDGPRTDRKLFRSADFGYVPREPGAPAAEPDARAAPSKSGTAPAPTRPADTQPRTPRRGPAPEPEDILDDEERANRAKYGGWKEGGDNDGGIGGGGNPFG